MLADQVHEILSARTDNGLIAHQIAERLGWASDQIRQKAIGTNGTATTAARTFFGRQPAALFVYARDRASSDLLRQSSSYAYHQTIRWGLVCDDEGISAFNSHWLRGGNILVLPKRSWDRVESADELLRDFTPPAIQDRAIDRTISKSITPDLELRSVDDELVYRLDKWRDQALRYSQDIQNIDDDLQVAYAQFFVLRTIEDRSLDPSLPPLSTTVESGLTVDRARLSEIFARARREVCGDLFAREVTQSIPDEIIYGVVRDLYATSIADFPYRYNFDWLTSDVLGSAYEKYLSTILAPAPPPSQLSLFEQPRREVQRFSVRRAGGIYYTPQPITRALTTAGLGQFPTPAPVANTVVDISNTFDGVRLPRIVDFACGSGSFLVAAIDELLVQVKNIDPSKDWVKAIVDNQLLVGIDIDEKAVTIARLNIWQRLTEEPSPLPLPSLSQLVFQGDSLREETWTKAPGKFDVVLGNPPFIATKFIPDRDFLEATFETARGRYDFSYLFVEQALRKLNPGGRLALVIPNRLFGNMDAGPIRDLVTKKTDLDLVVDFGSERPFPEASAYIGCIVATLRDSEPIAQSVRVIRILKYEGDRLSEQVRIARNSEREYRSEFVYSYTAIHPRGPSPWSLTSQEEKRRLVLIEEHSLPLSEVAAVRQGIRTGSNEIFIFQITRTEGASLLCGTNGLGEPCIVEREMARPVVVGPEIERYVVASPSSFLIYPYRAGVPLSEAELEVEAPQTFKYLNRYRNILSARRSIQGSKSWYELVRQRNEMWLASPKLLTRDLVPRSEFGLDVLGQSLLVGGTAIIPVDAELIFALCAYLNSSFVNGLLQAAAPSFRGGFLKLEPQHLENLPIPKEMLSRTPFRTALDDVAQKQIDANERSDEISGIELGKQLDEIIDDWLRKLD